jgi:hypothetical protein
MNTEIESQPRCVKRQADRSLFSTGGSGILLHFEDPAVLAFVRNAAEQIIQPANDFDRVFTELAVRSVWRALRQGALESAAIDVEMADHKADHDARWSALDAPSAYHLTMRDPAIRASIDQYADIESVSIRRFTEAAKILKSLRDK